MLNPSTVIETIRINKPFSKGITKPNDKIASGRVSKRIIGLINKFKIVSKKELIKIDLLSSKDMPSKKTSEIHNANKIIGQ